MEEMTDKQFDKILKIISKNTKNVFFAYSPHFKLHLKSRVGRVSNPFDRRDAAVR